MAMASSPASLLPATATAAADTVECCHLSRTMIEDALYLRNKSPPAAYGAAFLMVPIRWICRWLLALTSRSRSVFV